MAISVSVFNFEVIGTCTNISTLEELFKLVSPQTELNNELAGKRLNCDLLEENIK